MSDLISRKSLLNKINAYVVGSQDKEFICKLIKEMPSAENKGEWIPVSERLPEEEGRYLCTVGAEYRKVREMYYAPQPWADKSKKVTWRSIDGAYVYDWFIEAWQPMPEPYKAEKGGEE